MFSFRCWSRHLRTPVLALLVPLAPLAGQDRDAAALSLDSLLQIPVTAASRRAQTASAAPSSVTIITGDEIRALGLRTVGEILVQVPGFYATDDRNYLSVGVRGLGLPGDYNNRILLLLNGHPINDPQYGMAYLGTGLALDPATLERVEVVRGPGSALYGGNAMFAVVNLVTRDVSSLEGIAARARRGSHGRRGADVETAFRPARGVAAHVSATWETTDGESIRIPGMNPPITTHGLDEDELRSVAAEVSWGAWQLRGRLSDRDKGIGTGAWSSSFEDERAGTTDGIGTLELVWSRTLSARHALRVAASADRFSYGGTYTGEDSPGLYLDGSETRRVMVEGQWIWDAMPGTRVTAGGDYRDHYRQSYWYGSDAELWFDEDVPFESWSVFAMGERALSPRLTLVLGARHDGLSDGGGSTAPRAGLVFDDGVNTVKALAGSAFRFATFYERYFEIPQFLPGGDLHPESVRTIELVAARRLSGTAHAGVAVFHSDVKDVISIATLPGGDAQFQNGEGMRSFGVESSLDLRLPRRTVAHMSHTWVRARLADSDADAPNAPAHVLQMHGYGPLVGPLVLGFDGRLETARRTLEGARTDPVRLLNLHLSAPDVVSGLTPSVRIRNVVDRIHELPGGQEMPTDRVSQPGRQWVFELGYRF